MGPPSYKRSVVDRNFAMRCILVYDITKQNMVATATWQP